jgi:LacI family transcriptional regulator
MVDDEDPTPARKARTARRSAGAPTIADVAREAACSPMTVSRVINGDGSVGEARRQRVEAAVARLGYTPNTAARRLAGGEQARIALLFGNPSSSYLAEYLMGALEEAGRRDIQLVVQACETIAEGKAAIRKLAQRGIQGFVLPAPMCEDRAVVHLVRELGCVAIAVGSGVAGAVGPDSATGATGHNGATGAQGEVLIDDTSAARDMTTHLAALGHARIGFIMGNPRQVSATRRLEGYRQGLQQAGLPFDEALIAPGQFDYRSGLDAATALLAQVPRPTAIFASNDDMAAAAIAVAHRHQLDIPRDLSVCGFDDTAQARTVWPELTTVRQPIREMTAWAVAAAADMVRARRTEGGEVARRMMPYVLVRRDSDGPPCKDC